MAACAVLIVAIDGMALLNAAGEVVGEFPGYASDVISRGGNDMVFIAIGMVVAGGFRRALFLRDTCGP